MESEINVKNSVSWLTVQNVKVYWKQKTENEIFNNEENNFVYIMNWNLMKIKNNTVRIYYIVQMLLKLGYFPSVLALQLVIIE